MGQAPDGGLYMPEKYHAINDKIYSSSKGLSYSKVAFEVLGTLLDDDFPSYELSQICQKAYPFSPNLADIDESTQVLELFHGPTLSFKDFGARFMAKAMGYYMQQEDQELTILVATSGDTGSAVAHAYHNVEGIRIVLLYPSGKVSHLQEKQLTTLGDNVVALEVQGAFDDCQALVKKAFSDVELNQKRRFSSANSINIGRLLPQSVYYHWAVAHCSVNTTRDPLVCVPSGNFGNLTAGLFAGRMGMPVTRYIAAVNANAFIPDYLDTGRYEPRLSVRTLSNAMDVGNPSNWERIRDLYNDDYNVIKHHIWSTSVDDKSTKEAMKRTFEYNGYIADPHTCVGLEAIRRFKSTFGNFQGYPSIVLSTAHPGKFNEIVEDVLHRKFQLPKPLRDCLEKPKLAVPIPGDYAVFKEFLWEL